ncbi:hypothetical protein [Lactobacillus taiwanensis]|uniref:hypothetical protein n=1 Tax=Lactobacillus taiwanensis TaxID=508451 RepID=UPI0025AA0BEA|nr:hypothetical protein [Lactobacillus taiwanensis]
MLEKKMFINEENGAYYGVQNNEEFNSLAVDALKDDGVCIASYVGKAADYIKEIFNELSTVNKIKLFLFVEKQNTKRSPYLVPETMVSLMDKYADEWCDDDVMPLEFVSEDKKEFLSWAEDYVEGYFPDSFEPDYWDLEETLEYLESIEKNFMYRTIAGCSQGEIYYCFKLITNETVEEKIYFANLFAGDYLYNVLCETWVTIYSSDHEGDYIECILDTVGYVDGNRDCIGAEEIDDYMEKEFNARPALIEYV